MSTVIKDLGAVSAYAYAVEKGYTGTEAEFAELMADYAEVGQRAEDAAESALNSKTAAQTAATTATNKASEATTAAQTATTKAGEAQTSAQTASSKASEASQSASQASGYAQTAETAKTDAQTAKTQAETARDNAVTAKTAAETAQGKAEDAQAAAESVAESIPSDYSQLSEDVSDLKEGLSEINSVAYTEKIDIPWELGNVTITNTGWTYWTAQNNKRIRTPEGQQMHVTKGSVIKLTDYSDAEFFVGMRKDGVYTANGWISSGEFIAPISGEYVFVVRNKTEREQTDTSALSALFKLYIFGLSELNDRTAQNSEDIEQNTESIEKSQLIGLKTPFLVPAFPRFIMHRGYSANCPENTKAAFNLAGSSGAWGIETDIHETTDGYFVCFHDNDVERMTDGTGNINEMTLAQVQALTIDAGNHVDEYPNEKIPTLEEFLSICRRYGCVAVLEWKYIINEGDMLNIIKNAGMEQSVIFLVGATSTCRRLRVYTDAPCALLGFDGSDDNTIINNASTEKNLWADIVSYRITDTTKSVLAHSKNVPLIVYTVDNSITADTLFRLGVDAITTNSIPKFS